MAKKEAKRMVSNTVTRTVAYDVGGSGLRIVVDDSYESALIQPVQISVIPKEYPVARGIEDPLCEAVIEKDGQFLVRVVKDEGIGAYTVQEDLIGASVLKVDNKAFYYNILMYLGVIAYTKKIDDYKPLIGVAIPVREYYSTECVEKMKLTLCGEYKVTFLHDNSSSVNFKVEEARVFALAEGLCTKILLPEEAKVAMKKYNSIIVDIGARSSDISIIKNGIVQSKRALSNPEAGFLLEEILRSKLMQAGYDIAEDQMVGILKTGFLKNSEKDEGVNFTIQVNEAKEEFAQIVLKLIDTRITLAGISKDTLALIVLVGRPFSKSEDLFDIVDKIQKVFDRTEVLTLADGELANVRSVAKALQTLAMKYDEA